LRKRGVFCREVAAAAIQTSGGRALAYSAPELLQQHPELAALAHTAQQSSCVDPTAPSRREAARTRKYLQQSKEEESEARGSRSGVGSRLWERRAVSNTVLFPFWY
jgi:hypothetical protein